MLRCKSPPEDGSEWRRGSSCLPPVVSLLQNDVTTLKKWMADVDVFLNEEWPALGDSEALEKQLEQCTVSWLHRTHLRHVHKSSGRI